ncbi:MAG: flagellar hook-associated protein FlgL [Desulfobacter sp.]|nr:MAG: flagellar hook-associated protein FlgL [Desulfobacter sp.]
MRVPNINTYYTSTYRLGNLTEDLKNANEVVSTQKRINEISDDPLGLSQVLSLKNSVGNLEQIKENVTMGKSWLEAGEAAMDSVNKLILEAKSNAAKLANDSVTADERLDAIERIDSIIEQIVSLGNTQVNGSYIFGGTETDVPPFEVVTVNGEEKVIYKGNDTRFQIRTDRGAEVQVGRDGHETFWDTKIAINTTNNTIVFREDNGHGTASEKVLRATIPDGEYSTEDLETAVKNALNEASANDGYGANYVVDYDADTQTFSIREDGAYPGYLRTEFMWETGEDAYLTNVKTAGVDPDDVTVTVLNKNAMTIDTPEPFGTEPFTLTWQGNDTWKVDNNPGYHIFPETISGKRDYVAVDLDNNGSPDIELKLDTPVAQRGHSVSFEIVSAKGDHSTGHEIGFPGDNTVHAQPTSDQNATFVTELTIGVNDEIVFVETPDSTLPGTTRTAQLNTTGFPVVWTDMDALAQHIETQMEAAVPASTVNYSVTYDKEESRFILREDGSSLDELQVLWDQNANTRAAASTLGFYQQTDTSTQPASNIMTQMNITLTNDNNTIAFRETNGVGVQGGALTVKVPEGNYKTAADLETAIETAMNNESAIRGYGVTYDAAYDPVSHRFSIQRAGGAALNGLDMLWNSAGVTSMASTLGFDAVDDSVAAPPANVHTGDKDMVLLTFDTTNNAVDFQEIGIDGKVSDEIHIRIPEGEYTDMTDVATELQAELRKASPNNVDYVVEYDYTAGQFQIKGSDENIKGFNLLWLNGGNYDENARNMLGFFGDASVSAPQSDAPVVNIKIDGTNNIIDFMEIKTGSSGKKTSILAAEIEPGYYTSHERLAKEVEKAIEAESRSHGQNIDYTVTWDSETKKFTIKENGTELDEFHLMWNSGDHAAASAGGTGESAAGILGFDSASDDIYSPMESQREVEWGIFTTLLDMKQYLSENDRDGIERTIGRLETDYDSMTSKIVDSGMRFSRLDVRDNITNEVKLSLNERRSNIEDADMIESVMKLQGIETAYKAALSATSKVLNISLVDYLR